MTRHDKLRDAIRNNPRYLIEVFWSDEDGGYVAVAPDLPGCHAYGDTPEEAMHEMNDAMASWMQAWTSLSRPMPEAATRPRMAA